MISRAIRGIVAAVAISHGVAAAPAADKPAAAAPHAPGVAADGSVEVIVVRVGPPDKQREQPIVAGSSTVFADCQPQQLCPLMLVVPSSQPGQVLGELDGQDASKRLHGVALQSFAIGKTEVSVAEYERCVRDGGCRPQEWREPGGQFNIETGPNAYYKHLEPNLTDPNAPIVGISHTDAVAYTQWLSNVTGQSYRLPSETEWEYAARAGTHTTYWWGADVQHDGKAMATCRGCGSEWDAKTNAPVSSFAPNPWGLHNVHGNVWEWVADYYCGDFSTNPRDGSPRSTDACPVKDAPDLRVLRGGSSFYEPRFMTSATRLRNYSTFRNYSVGFRVARTLLP